MLEYSSFQRTSPAPAAPTERARLAEAGERQAAGTSFISATAYGVGRMIEDYLKGHHFSRCRLEEIMTVLLNPDRGPHSLSAAGARALLAARVAA